LIFNSHREAAVFLFHEGRGNQEVCGCAVAGDWDDRARRAGCEEIVVQKDTAVTTSPIEEIVLAVVVSDHGDALSGVHQ